jgi:dynein heavy chain
LRQLQDLGGFYDRTKLFFKQVVDITMLPVCAPPGGGRNQLSFRFLRHMIPLNFPTPNSSTAFKIFNSLLAPNCSFS